MCEILREHAVNTDYRKRDKNIKVPAVIPIVLYNGEERWNVPNEFRKVIYNENLFGNGLLNFKYDVFDIGNDEEFSKEKLIGSKNVTITRDGRRSYFKGYGKRHGKGNARRYTKRYGKRYAKR